MLYRILPLLVLLTSCGFEPLYAPMKGSETSLVQSELARIKVGSIPDRAGQLMRIHLGHLLTPYGPASRPAYDLEITLGFEETGLSFLKDDTSTRMRITLTVNYILRDKERNELVRDSYTSVTEYNVVLSSDYSTTVASEHARVEAVTNAARELSVRLANYFSEKNG